MWAEDGADDGRAGDEEVEDGEETPSTERRQHADEDRPVVDTCRCVPAVFQLGVVAV